MDKNCLQDLQSDEVVYTETIDSTMRDYIITSNMAADASAIPTLEPSEQTDISRYVHWSDKNWTYNGNYDNRYDMFLEGINGLIDMGGFGWHYGQYLSSNAILGLIDGTTSQHVLLHEMGHSFGFPDYYGGIGESDGIPPGDFPGSEGSIMEAGRSFKITPFDTWFARYAWTKLSAQEGRFDMSSVTPPTTEQTTEPITEPTTELTTDPASNLKTIEFEDTISAIEPNDNGGTIHFSANGSYNFSGTEYYGGDESKNLLHYESGDIISIRFTYHTETGKIESIETLSIKQNVHNPVTGDVNADGEFNAADVIMLQKWLISAGDITDWQAGDFLKDEKLNVFDLCIMKREFLNK